MTVYVVVTGDGSDGCEYETWGVFSTAEKARGFIHRNNQVGGTMELYSCAHVDRWVIDAECKAPV